MSLRRLRARLDRLELSASTMPGQDRKRDRIRREELSFRKRQQQVLTDREEDDLLALETLLYDVCNRCGCCWARSRRRRISFSSCSA
jgi:hypothetical protein